MHPKHTLKVGNWNVRTLYRSGNIAQVVREMKRKGIDIMGISEMHRTGQGKVQLAEGDSMIYSGRDDVNHKQGVAILMSKSAARALIEWNTISERIIRPRYYSKYVKLTVIHFFYTHQRKMQMKRIKMSSIGKFIT